MPLIRPEARVSRLELPEHHSCLVIDDILVDPDAVVARAATLRHAFQARGVNAYPGLELTLSGTLPDALEAFFHQHVGPRFGASPVVVAKETRFAMVTRRPEELAPRQRLCHVDDPSQEGATVTVAGVLYLFRDPRLGGTDFYTLRAGVDLAALQATLDSGRAFNLMARYPFFRRPPAYLTASCEFFELRRSVPAAFNRMIFYRADVYHSGHIGRPDLLTDDPRTGRLTLNCFFKCQRRQGAAGPRGDG